MKLIFMGPPGAGKGTQAQRIENKHELIQLSTGDMLRTAVAAGTQTGKKVKAIMARGDLVPDEVVVDIILDRTAQDDCAKGYILDGFPRNVAQAEALDAMLSSRNEKIDSVLELSVDESALLSRIKSRAADTAGTPRMDDTAEVLKKRLAIYREQTAPLIDYYRRKGVLKLVNGMKKIDEVTAQIEGVLGL